MYLYLCLTVTVCTFLGTWLLFKLPPLCRMTAKSDLIQLFSVREYGNYLEESTLISTFWSDIPSCFKSLCEWAHGRQNRAVCNSTQHLHSKIASEHWRVKYLKLHIYSRSVCTHRGVGPAPGGVRGAESQSTAKLWRRVDLCGRSGAPDQSPWCGEPSCFHDFSHPHQQSNLSGSAETAFSVQSARNL